ncbi:hypothetical protein SLEP1_g55772 [Rubroshorea leprosula]|uniref:Uncharacterized protein n=1 Tax=Rubroshorea leprosula TaxID=152421 RepID=A0AAV5MGC4_9ROSI|nr:hypothetical protein SLEP1_g55772 [Rubroshorea leprosula]
MIDAAEIYGMSSLSEGGNNVTLPKKKSKDPAAAEVEERTGAGTSSTELRQLPEEVPVEFIPWSLPVDINLELREVGVVTHRKEKSIIPLPVQKSSFYQSSSRTATKRFLNSTFSEVDLKRAQEKMDADDGVGVVRHALEV